ncbi:MAG: hypothetical protein K9I95_14050 [Flavobacteriaceae bacterium]|nr:hypothetical protein [Flavobacteriaceae bacterium]
MQINFPTIGEYNQLIQKKGGDAFRSLKGMILIPVRTTPIKVFLFGSGAFAAVFKGSYDGKIYAIRCFLTIEKNTIERYKIICDYVKKINSTWKTDCEFIDYEIMVNGKSFPILKMEWVEGNLINNFITKHLNNKHLISEIQEKLVDMSNDLESHGIGHGDLQCGNIIITGDSSKFQIRLIDYDGMYVPELVNKKSVETGRSEFQHPKRDINFYNEKIDRFSFWVILTALEALKHDKSLWLEVMQGGFNTLDNFLFTVQDFLNPNQSKLFNRLYKINSSSLNFYLDNLKQFCNNDISLIEKPRLENQALKSNYTSISQIIQKNDLGESLIAHNLLKDKYKIISIEGEAVVLTSSFEKIGNTPLELDKNLYTGKTIIISNGLEIKQILLTSHQNFIEVDFSKEKKSKNIDNSLKKKPSGNSNEYENSEQEEDLVSNRQKIIRAEIAKLEKKRKEKEKKEKKALDEASNLKRQKEIRDENTRLEKEKVLRIETEKKAFEEAAKLKQKKKKREHQLKLFRIFVIIGILFILAIVSSIYYFGGFNNDEKKEIISNRFNSEDYFQIINDLLTAEEQRDFEKIYSYFSPNISRYWDLNNPSSNSIKKRYEYIWGFTMSSRNFVQKIEKISDNTYDLYTKYEYYNLNKKDLSSSNSIVRYIFDGKGKIIETYGIENSNEKVYVEKKIFYNDYWEICYPESAEYYRKITLDESGKPIGKVKEYYISGHLYFEGEISELSSAYYEHNIVMEGICIWYYKNGNIKQKGNFKNGELDGFYTTYYENGDLEQSDIYLNGEVINANISYPENDTEKTVDYTDTKSEVTSNFDANKTYGTTMKIDGKLRDKPIPMSNIIKYIPKGASIKVLSYYDNYYEVKYLNEIGYINEIYLVETNEMNSLKGKVSSNTSIYTNSNSNNKNLSTTLKMEGKLRDKPGIFSYILILIPKGASIKVLSYYDNYYEVKYLNKIGYINEMYLVETYEMLNMKTK